jgi:hypothetical protein
VLTASSPEAQKRLSCTPATVVRQPATSAADAGDVSRPARPPATRTPSTMSSILVRPAREVVAPRELVQQVRDQRDRLHLVQ